MFRFATLMILAVAVRVCWRRTGTNAPAPTPAPALEPVSPRDFYNTGTRLLDAKQFADAEKMFESSLAAQDDRLQPPAMYNLGHTRFADGADLLKKGPDAEKVSARGRAALAEGDHAIDRAEAALVDNQMNSMINAYLEGRGARHDLREAEKALQAAMETYGKTLQKWLRAADDFKGAAELNPADTNATENAEKVERALAKLVDSLRRMQAMMGELGQKRQGLGKELSKLKGRIPAPNAAESKVRAARMRRGGRRHAGWPRRPERRRVARGRPDGNATFAGTGGTDPRRSFAGWQPSPLDERSAGQARRRPERPQLVRFCMHPRWHKIILPLLIGAPVLCAQTPPQIPAAAQALLQVQQPTVDNTTPVTAQASFDPPLVRAGERTFYRVDVTATESAIQWPAALPAPGELKVTALARGQITQFLGNTFRPLTTFLYEVRPAAAGQFMITNFSVSCAGQPVGVPPSPA